METLLEDYKRKQKTIREMIEADDVTEETLKRLKVKQGMINSFIVDIYAAMARCSDDSSNCNLADVSERYLHINDAAALIKSMPTDQAIQKIKVALSGQPETTVIDGELLVSLHNAR